MIHSKRAEGFWPNAAFCLRFCCWLPSQALPPVTPVIPPGRGAVVHPASPAHTPQSGRRGQQQTRLLLPRDPPGSGQLGNPKPAQEFGDPASPGVERKELEGDGAGSELPNSLLRLKSPCWVHAGGAIGNFRPPPPANARVPVRKAATRSRNKGNVWHLFLP